MAQVEIGERQLTLFPEWGPDMAKLRKKLEVLGGKTRADSTLRAYRSDWGDFAAWCQSAGRVSMPATPETVSLYLVHLLETRKLSTVDRRAAAISALHKADGHASPVTADVRKVLHGARRVRGDDSESKAAFTVDELRKVLRHLERSPWGVRDAAILLIGFASGMRRSELSGLDVADLAFTAKGLRIRIRRSKRDQLGEGREVGVFAGRRKTTCPVAALKRWLYLRGKKDGPLFVGILPDGGLTGDRLSGQAIGDMVKRAVRRAGLEVERYGAHSLRAGMVTRAIEDGCPESLVMRVTGHKSLSTLHRYVRPASLFGFNPLARAL